MDLKLIPKDAEIRAASSVLLERIQFMRQAGITFKGMRDLYEILGYNRVITNKDYRDRYARGGIAARIIEALPNATWRGGWELVEDENPKVSTKFEKAWEELETRLRISAVLRKVDILAGLSTYAVLLIGGKGDLDTELEKGGPDDLLYLTPFAGGGGPNTGYQPATIDADATIQTFEIDTENERFGLPNTYQLRRLDVTSPKFQRQVHWSRIIHIAEGTLDNEIYGQPSLERVWNLLDDLDKVTGGGAEAFWLRANQGIQLDVDKDMTLGVDEKKALQEQADEYQHQIRRMLRTRGVKVETLGSDVANFSNPADAILTQIAGAKSIPKRILTGSEMGELASSQDRDNWKDQVNGRQTSYAAPYIVRPLVDRLIKYGYLPTPKKGERAYEVKWAHIQTLTEQEKSEGANKWALTATAEGPVFNRDEIRDKWYGMEPIPKPEVDTETGEHTSPETGLPLDPKVDPTTGLPLKVPPAATVAVDPVTGLPVEVDTKTGLPAHVTEEAKSPAEKAAALKKAKADREKKLKAAEARLLTEGPHQFASTQLNLPYPLSEDVERFPLPLEEVELAPLGREMTPHVTVLYGLHSDNAAEVRAALENVGPITITLQTLNYFETEDGDALYVTVDSPDLLRVNARLSELDHTNSHGAYKPHVTIAYLKSGHGQKYVGDRSFVGRTVTIDELVFSPRDGAITKITLDQPLARAAELTLIDAELEMIKVLEAAVSCNNTAVIDAILGINRTAGGAGSGNFGHEGRPGEVGGSGDGGGGWENPGGFQHTGIEWKQATDPVTGRPIPIKVDNLDDAVRLILDGKVVEVKDVTTAHTLINKMAEMANEAKAAGKEAKDYDLCNVSVGGTNLFCTESVRNEKYPEGITRIEMPQLGGKAIPGSEADKLPHNPKNGEVNGSAVFMNHLQSIGMKTSEETVPAGELRASQRELRGNTVGGMMTNAKYDPAKEPIYISSDNYVVDGHHRWAAVVGRDAADGHLGDSTMRVIRINAPISEVLHIASAWSTAFGIKQGEGVVKQAAVSGLHKGKK